MVEKILGQRGTGEQAKLHRALKMRRMAIFSLDGATATGLFVAVLLRVAFVFGSRLQSLLSTLNPCIVLYAYTLHEAWEPDGAEAARS